MRCNVVQFSLLASQSLSGGLAFPPSRRGCLYSWHTVVWPDGGKTIFVMPNQPFSRNSKEPTHADVGWLSRQGLGHLGYAYREAAEILCEAPAKCGTSEEAMYLVASFAFRHSIELYLKAVLPLVAIHADVTVPNEFQGKHGLLPMWDWISERLADMGNHSLLQDGRSVIEAFDLVDPNGTAFRYNLDLKGNAQLKKLPPAVSLGNLKNAASEVIYLLDGLEEYLSEGAASEA